MSKYGLPWTQGVTNQGRECVFINGFVEPENTLGPTDSWIDCGCVDRARLIAAAPDLLAVAQRIRAHGTISSTWIDDLDAAISKATGEK